MCFRKSSTFCRAVTCCAIAFTVARAENASPRGRLYFVGVAYDEGPPKGKTLDHFNYAPDNFSTLLAMNSKELFSEIRPLTIKGKAVTRNGVFAKLRALERVVNKEDLLFIYWGTHGGTTAKGWSTTLADGQAILGSEIKRQLARFNCPVITVISTCGSGGFARPTPKDVPLPENVTALCACQKRQSTGNELDMALCEALAGFADADGNGEVTLGEAYQYVPKRYRAWFPKTAADDDPDQIPVLGHSGSAPLDRPLTKVAGTHAAVVQDGKWYGVRILEQRDKKYKVRFLGCDSTCADGGYSMPDAFVEDNVMDLPGSFSPIDVEWDGAWYPARILKQTKSGARIHYIGYPDSDDETVSRERIRLPFGGTIRTGSGRNAARARD